jgi:hypothetical protein
MSNPVILNPSPVALIYAPGVQEDATTSLTAHGARAMTVEGISAATPGIKVQTRLSDDGAWSDYQTLATAAPVVLIVFPVNFNRVRVINLAAANKVICQG